MLKRINYEVLKNCPQNTLFFFTEEPSILLIKLSKSESKFFTYASFFNYMNNTFSEESLSELVRIKFNELMNKTEYLILEKEDLKELSELFNHLNENFGKHNNYTLH